MQQALLMSAQEANRGAGGGFDAGEEDAMLAEALRLSSLESGEGAAAAPSVRQPAADRRPLAAGEGGGGTRGGRGGAAAARRLLKPVGVSSGGNARPAVAVVVARGGAGPGRRSAARGAGESVPAAGGFLGHGGGPQPVSVPSRGGASAAERAGRPPGRAAAVGLGAARRGDALHVHPPR